MGVSLSKGGNVSLSKEAANPLTSLTVTLKWKPQTRDGQDIDPNNPKSEQFDLDASALIADENDKILSDEHFIFYNKKTSPDGSVTHSGDDKTGAQGEKIKVDVTKLDQRADKVVFVVTIHEADARGQNFGRVRGASIVIVDDNDGKELARYDLTEDAASQTAMIFGELYRKSGEIKFRAVGEGYSAGLRGVALDYGVNVA